MATVGLKDGDVPCLPELSVVLLGKRDAGKSLAGNTILGRDEFAPTGSALCAKGQGDVAGRQVTVVDTPGWWQWGVEYTPELIVQEIRGSVTLCPPGPHAHLIVIQAEVFSEKYRSVVQQQVELLGEKVWRHAIVLFTPGSCVGDKTVEQYIESQGKALRWLVRKCGGRYHFLDVHDRGDGAQVTELLEKIEKMVAGNGGRRYEMEREMKEEVEMKRQAVNYGAMKRRAAQEKQRQSLKEMGDPPRLSKLRIVLLGFRIAGKTSAGNTIFGRQAFHPKTGGAECVMRQGEVAGKEVTVVDTPGWWFNMPIEFTPKLIQSSTVRSVCLCPPGPHAFLLHVRLDVSFTEKYRQVLVNLMEPFSDRVWSHTVLVFTVGDCLRGATVEQFIESEGEALLWLVERCGNRYHVLDNDNSGDGSQVTELLEKIEDMVAGNGGGHYEVEREMQQEIEEKWKIETERAEQRLLKVQKQTNPLRWVQANDAPFRLSELQIALIGVRQAGKTASRNTILNNTEININSTTRCGVTRGEVAGKLVTVVDTPGWGWLDLVKNTPEKIKQEIASSVSMCAPRQLHVFVVVIWGDFSFTEKVRVALLEHVNLLGLGDRFWRHAMLLFTWGDHLGDTSIERYIESEGKALQWLVEKCGNRYHVIDNENMGDGSQVTELLEKIEGLVLRNQGECVPTASLRRAESNPHLPAMMSGDDRSETSSLRTSGYGTWSPSATPSDAECESLAALESELASHSSLSSQRTAWGSTSSKGDRGSLGSQPWPQMTGIPIRRTRSFPFDLPTMSGGTDVQPLPIRKVRSYPFDIPTMKWNTDIIQPLERGDHEMSESAPPSDDGDIVAKTSQLTL